MPFSPRSRILGAAADLFAAQGYAAIGMREIAAQAGVHESTVFRLFGNKQGLARAVMARTIDRVHASTVDRAIRSSASLADAAPLYAAWYAQYIGARVVRLWMVLAVENGVHLTISKAHIAMVEKIASAQENGEAVAGDPKSILRALHSALMGNAIVSALDHPIVDPGATAHREVAAIVRIWLRGVLR
jgi:AcrR family transcriptional regulator